MPYELKAGTPFIFMKVGVHANEPLAEIIKRKREEIAKAGVSFWGYGGGTCHPITAVQPFVKRSVEGGMHVNLLMQEINSRHYAPAVRAEEYSADGVTWHKVPRDVHVLGSRYALVLDSLDEIDSEVTLDQTAVGVGRMQGV